MSYTLNYGKDGNTSLTVPDGQSGTVANLTFPGRNFSGYGSPVDQNFLSIVENFTSANVQGPQNPITGQLWYDVANTESTNQGLKVFDDTGSSANLIPHTDWTNLVTFDKPANVYANGMPYDINPKDISGVGTLSATTGNFTALKANTGNFTTNVTSPLGNFTSMFAGNSTSNVVISNAGVTINGGTLSLPTATITGNLTTGNLYGGNLVEANFGQFNNDVLIKGNIVVQGTTTTASSNSFTVVNPIISLGGANGANLTANDGKDRGLHLVYYNSTQKDAFIGYKNPNAAAQGNGANFAGEFIIASSADFATTTDVAGITTLGNLRAGNANFSGGTVTATTFSGNLANGTSKVSIPALDGNVNISSGANANVLVVAPTYVTITGSAATTNSTGALRVAGGVGITGNLYVGGSIVGSIGSTSSNIAGNQANVNKIIASTGDITSLATGTVTTTSTATLNQLLVNTSAQVGSFVSNTSVETATLKVTSGANIVGTLTATTISAGAANTTAGTINGAWSLTAGSTLEATYSADLAERHHADDIYPTGSVMTVGGINEITGASTTSKVLGVVSDDWAYLMNGGAGPQETHPAVAYVGRVPVRIVGPVNKHDEVSPFANGVATSSKENSFGWALETNLDIGEKLVLCIVK
jgi:hypothetical protein